ncbi:Protein flightless-1-like protein [Colletotrichum orbiculare MAFF 240422]|uniref:Protein flightless-1-like protein n=1 Tax=Colletotrichum orbiculare (strain 104-T / ATCC 96160 / CBS 514.97 / LARS 414 / MAFF 240422) TaxID=1213857 RepID=N4V672_COLOR|nr:Protein flightless-1-like protein [Colletotrichum orbiculare MAFF 240422]
MSEQAMDDVSKFLQDVKEMNARRTEEDDARQRELDEKIQQEKRERQARRAERARSISPQKSSPANTPPPSSQRNNTQLSDDLKLSSPGLEHTGSPRSHSRAIAATDALENMSSTSPTKENDSPFDTDDQKRASVISPTGSVQGARPLSWQRRPNSQHSDRPKSRPLSVVAAENAARTSPNPTSDPSSATEQNFSKDQIAQALGSKDPSWFRQTADRASVGSAANRKSQVEDTDTTDMSSMRAQQLPGMSRSSSTDLSPEHTSPTKESRLGSPLPLTSAQRLDPPAEISSDNDNPARRSSALSSGSGRMSPGRPISPTKGMGGFVQSAMMKRSDSVKRWSVTSPSGLVRADSVASNRTGESRSRPQSMVMRDGTSTPTRHARSLSRPASRHASRPASRHGTQEQDNEEETTPKAAPASTTAPAPVPAAEPEHELKPKADPKPAPEEEKLTPPSSPSKTMDTRRWSPTKASWLETALNKPESPKPKPPPTANQPAWMVELNKAKAHKAANPSADLGRTGSVSSQKHEVSIGGLMRSSPMGGHNSKPSVSGLKGIFAPPIESHQPANPSTSGTNFRGNQLKSPINDNQPEDEAAEAPKRSSVGDGPAAAKVKPETPPKKDFRANLKPRNLSGDASSREQPNELQSVFGNLRRTKTQNYVPPDELKGNIVRGKAGLNNTGGPKPSERKDEFKEAILKKKGDFKAAQEQGRGVARSKSNAADKPVPEGLIKKAELSKSTSHKPNFSSDFGVRHRKSVSERPKSVYNVEASESSPTIKSPITSPITSPVQKEASASGHLQGRAAAGGLAGRFNPGLAGLLARGPPSMATNGGKDAEKSEGATASASEPTAPGPQLTHMTKGRARGPKRKAPSKAAAATSPGPDSETKPSAVSTPPAEDQVAEAEEHEDVKKDTPPSIHAQVAAQAALKHRPAPLKPFERPAEESAKSFEKPAEKSVEKPVFSPSDAEPVPVRRTRSPTMKLQASPVKLGDEKPSEPVSQPTSPKKLDMKRVSRFFEDVNQPAAKPESPKRDSVTTGTSPQLKAESPKIEKVASPPAVKPKPESPKMERVASPTAVKSTPDSPRRDSPVASPTTKPKPESFSRESPVTSPSMRPKPVFEKPSGPAPQKAEDSPFKTFGRPLPEHTPSSPKKSFAEGREEPLAPLKTFGRPLPDPTIRSPIRSPVRSPPSNEYNPHVAPLRLSRPSSPQKGLSNDKVDSESVVSVKNAAALFGGARVQSPPTVKSPPMQSPPSETRSRFESSAPTVERTSTPKAAVRPLPIPPKPSSPTPISSPVRSPTKLASDVSALLDDFFGTPRPQREYKVDTAEVLMNKPRVRNIHGQGGRLFQITGDGKKIPVPAHNERILFEREMYICAYTFSNDAGKKATEVYFWAGDEVPAATVEDAALFVNREARSLGGKLVRMRQGRETPEFIQGLGGMVITRRGSSTKYDSLAPSMLCGRRILGQSTFVFDEVDFASASLCSGFPFLITQSGKCYLWKGKGSDVDELSCARLIGMDLTLTGELLEIEDGSEPDSFWDIFSGGPKPHSADHWRLKPNYDQYCQRLFRAEATSKQQVYEIAPFTQADLDPSGIYVLDAFFEMYIVVGRTAQSQYSSFRIALDFAQEYAILASGMEDRPFIPISTVVLEGIPKDLKSVFRKWSDEASPTIMPPRSATPGLKRGRSLRVVPLTQALQALSE